MQPIPGYEFHGGTNQNDILGRQVLAQINRSLREFQPVKIAVAAHIRVSLHETVHLDIGRVDESPQRLHGR